MVARSNENGRCAENHKNETSECENPLPNEQRTKWGEIIISNDPYDDAGKSHNQEQNLDIYGAAQTSSAWNLTGLYIRRFALKRKHHGCLLSDKHQQHPESQVAIDINTSW